MITCLENSNKLDDDGENDDDDDFIMLKQNFIRKFLLCMLENESEKRIICVRGENSLYSNVNRISLTSL